MRCIDASTIQPSAPWASIDIAEPGDEHVAHPAHPDAGESQEESDHAERQ